MQFCVNAIIKIYGKWKEWEVLMCQSKVLCLVSKSQVFLWHWIESTWLVLLYIACSTNLDKHLREVDPSGDTALY